MIELEDRIVRFVARCIKVCAVLPAKSIGSSSFADQMFRSSTSIAANYAEACEAESAKDFVHKLKVFIVLVNSVIEYASNDSEILIFLQRIITSYHIVFNRECSEKLCIIKPVIYFFA